MIAWVAGTVFLEEQLPCSQGMSILFLVLVKSENDVSGKQEMLGYVLRLFWTVTIYEFLGKTQLGVTQPH